MNSDIKNMIILWSGAIADIPTGYHLCDGTAGTPDLRDKFIVGAGSTYDPDDNGGTTTHTHTGTGIGHVHSFLGGAGLGSGADGSQTTSNSPGTLTTDPATTLPTYYALAYIMKL